MYKPKTSRVWRIAKSNKELPDFMYKEMSKRSRMGEFHPNVRRMNKKLFKELFHSPKTKSNVRATLLNKYFQSDFRFPTSMKELRLKENAIYWFSNAKWGNLKYGTQPIVWSEIDSKDNRYLELGFENIADPELALKWGVNLFLKKYEIPQNSYNEFLDALLDNASERRLKLFLWKGALIDQLYKIQTWFIELLKVHDLEGSTKYSSPPDSYIDKEYETEEEQSKRYGRTNYIKNYRQTIYSIRKKLDDFSKVANTINLDFSVLYEKLDEFIDLLDQWEALLETRKMDQDIIDEKRIEVVMEFSKIDDYLKELIRTISSLDVWSFDVPAYNLRKNFAIPTVTIFANRLPNYTTITPDKKNFNAVLDLVDFPD